jgi:hypothetical protein
MALNGNCSAQGKPKELKPPLERSDHDSELKIFFALSVHETGVRNVQWHTFCRLRGAALWDTFAPVGSGNNST